MGGHGPGPMGSGTALLPCGSVAHGSAGYGGVQHRGRGSTSVARGPGRPHPGPSWSFVFDPAGRLCYYWSMVVSLAFLYNFWVIIYRFAFQEINRKYCIHFLKTSPSTCIRGVSVWQCLYRHAFVARRPGHLTQ